jgi:hypothetical protein
MKPEGVRQRAADADAMILAAAAPASEPATDGVTEGDGTVDTPPSTVVDHPTARQQRDEDDSAPTREIEALQIKLEHETREREKAESRHRTLEGMLRATNERMEGLRALIAAGQQSDTPPAPAAEPAPAAREVTGVSKADEDTFGADLCEYIEARIQAHVGSAVSGLSSKLDNVTSRVETTSTVVAKTQQQRFEEALDAEVPDWRELDKDDGFIQFVQYDRLYQPAWRQALQDLDAETAAGVMRAYKARLGDAPAAKHDDKVRRQLETQVAPEKSRSDKATPASDSSQPKQWKMSEIRAVYADLSKPPSQRRYTAEQFNAIEQDISKAQAENRVDYD